MRGFGGGGIWLAHLVVGAVALIREVLVIRHFDGWTRAEFGMNAGLFWIDSMYVKRS
jgi:hypothetical protein